MHTSYITDAAYYIINTEQEKNIQHPTAVNPKTYETYDLCVCVSPRHHDWRITWQFTAIPLEPPVSYSGWPSVVKGMFIRFVSSNCKAKPAKPKKSFPWDTKGEVKSQLQFVLGTLLPPFAT